MLISMTKIGSYASSRSARVASVKSRKQSEDLTHLLRVVKVAAGTRPEVESGREMHKETVGDRVLVIVVARPPY